MFFWKHKYVSQLRGSIFQQSKNYNNYRFGKFYVKFKKKHQMELCIGVQWTPDPSPVRDILLLKQYLV